MSNGKSYMPKVLTFTVGENFNPQDMEDQIASFTLNGWKIISMTHFQYKEPSYTVLLQYEFSEEEMQKSLEKSA